jgi:hypothetical protein
VCGVLYRAEEQRKELWGFIPLGNEGLQLFGDSLAKLWGSSERLMTLLRDLVNPTLRKVITLGHLHTCELPVLVPDS